MIRRAPAAETSPSPDRVLQTLQWMRKNGFKPVALHHASKAAINKSYADRNYAPPADDLWRNHLYGIGVVTGPAQSGPVDVDLDCEEAIFFASRFLPQTGAVFGRKSKPRSHYLYVVDTSTFEKKAFNDPMRTEAMTIVEARGDGGHQTVMPGSTHEASKEIIEWSDVAFPEVAKVSSDELIAAIRKIAIATIIVRHIWADGYHNEPCKHISGLLANLEWPQEDVEELISAVMEYSGDTDRSRLPTIRATYRRVDTGKKVTGAGILRKQLNNDRLVDRLLEWAGSPTVNLLQEYNDRYAVISLRGKFRIVDTDVSPGEVPVFFQKDDWLNFVSTDYSDVTNEKGVRQPKGKVWLANPRRRTYNGADFIPGSDDLSGTLNLWTGWAVQPSDAGSCKAWLELLRTVICGNDQKLYEWMLHWFANILREPCNKSLTAPVIIGPEGAGKSLLLGYFGKILGPGYTVVTNEEHVHGKFNSHLGHTLLLHSEEALYGGDKKHAGIIRSLITDDKRMLEPKGIDAQQIRNYIRLVLTSNELYAAPAKPGDRRYTVVNMEDRKASSKLIRKVLEELGGGGPAALHHYLITMKYDPEIPRTNVKNSSLLALKSMNMTPVEGWWFDVLSSGQVLPDFLSWCTQPEKDDWPPVVSAVALYTAMSMAFKDRNVRMVPSKVTLAFEMEKFLGIRLLRSQREYNNPLLDEYPPAIKGLSGRQNSIINMPPLSECRAAFEKYLGQPIDWPTEDPDAKGRVKGQPNHDKF